MRTRVLLTGASGLLGGRLASLLGGEFEVVAARHESVVPDGLETVRLDLLSPRSIESALETARPQAVLHAAALADADRCQRQPALAEAVNVRGTEHLARSCRSRGLRMVMLSTDLVLSGDLPFSRETEPPHPLLAYGHTKLAAEAAVRAEAPGSAIARIALVVGRGFGPRGTATETIAWALRARRRLWLYTDQLRTPVDAESLAAPLAELLRGEHAGLFHLGGPERLSRFDLGLRVAQALALEPSLIEPVTQDTHRLAAPRPSDASLDSDRARRELGFAPRSLEAAIRDGRPFPDETPPE